MESFFTPAHRVVVSVPATTSNLGPGFDSMGFALNLRNRVVVERADEFSIEVYGEGQDGNMIPSNESNAVVQGCYRALESLGKLSSMPPLRFECHNTVPCLRGLGSSSSALVLGLAAGFALGGKELYTPISKKELLQMAADEEGHADNIAAAIYGGFQVSFKSEAAGKKPQWITQRVSVPKGLHCVLFIPDESMRLVGKEVSRGALPAYYRREDAVHNIGRAAMLVNCFATGQFDALRFAMEDRLHQQYRAGLFPFEPLLHAALAAGAHGAFLSSQGPAVVAICGGNTGIEGLGSDTMSQFLAEAVSQALSKTAEQFEIKGDLHVACPEENGIVSSGFDEQGSPLWGQEWESYYSKAM
uniref:GHMP kinase N-terminal domain-containing protein n=1 Tax=Haptolina brevifila TaxID=156173 RepID=A0A7S2CUX3_9EUKA